MSKYLRIIFTFAPVLSKGSIMIIIKEEGKNHTQQFTVKTALNQKVPAYIKFPQHFFFLLKFLYS